MEWTGHATHTGKIRNAYSTSEPTFGWKDNKIFSGTQPRQLVASRN
jgi:hypothetical protein